MDWRYDQPMKLMVWYGMVWGTLRRDPPWWCYTGLEKDHLRKLFRCPRALPPAHMEWAGRTCYTIAHRGIANSRFGQNQLVATYCFSAYFQADNGFYSVKKKVIS